MELHRQHAIQETNTAKARDGYKKALEKSLKKLTKTTNEGINALWYLHAVTPFLMGIEIIILYLQLAKI